MEFTAEETARFERWYELIEDRLALLKNYPAGVKLVPGEDLFIWKRLEQMQAMTKEELMEEIIADYVLLPVLD